MYFTRLRFQSDLLYPTQKKKKKKKELIFVKSHDSTKWYVGGVLGCRGMEVAGSSPQNVIFSTTKNNSTVFMLLIIVKAVGWEVSRRICWHPPLSNRRTEFESGPMHWCIMGYMEVSYT